MAQSAELRIGAFDDKAVFYQPKLIAGKQSLQSSQPGGHQVSFGGLTLAQRFPTSCLVIRGP